MSADEACDSKVEKQLPKAPKAVGSYVPAIKFGNVIVTSGQLPIENGQIAFEGKVPEIVDPEEATDAAELAAVNCVAQIEATLGDLKRITQIVRVEGYVNSNDDFTGQPGVMDGASDWLESKFGATVGRHTRIAVGVNALPLNAAVEVVIWATFE